MGGWVSPREVGSENVSGLRQRADGMRRCSWDSCDRSGGHTIVPCGWSPPSNATHVGCRGDTRGSEGGRSNTGQLSSSDAAELATAAVDAIWDVQRHLHHTLKLRTQPLHSPRLHTTSTLTQDSGGGVNTQAYCRDEGSRDQPTVPPKLGMIKVLQRGKVAHWQDTMCCRNALGCAVGKRTKECQLEPQPALATSVMSVRSTFERKCPCLQL